MDENFKSKNLKNIGIEVEIPESYDFIETESLAYIEESIKNYPKAKECFNLLVNDPEVRGDWDLANFIAVKKLKYNDHGEVHAKIVCASALKMLDILLEKGIKPDFIKEGGGDEDDEHLIILSAALLHDIGNQIYREDHPLHSTYLAIPILERILPKFYEDLEQRTEVRGFILNTIYAHDADVPDYTIEASLVGIGDATDMTKGRGRMAYDLGSLSIHTISALAIERVLILKGEEKPIEIVIEMSNSSGIFQVQEILGKKIINGPLENFISLKAQVTPTEAEYDKRIVRAITLKGSKFVSF
ncbi:MAG: phosphohydrolase [Caldisericia bacterium]|nr:phosphohydrolase [Caldisericia bacterium]